jgi:REP element-mobilizing transposase RayT
MSRKMRDVSETGIYHAILRGINKQTIFEDNEDYNKFLQILDDYKILCGYKLYGYCLMGNHVHLLIHENEERISKIFKRIGVKYVCWYNNKYNRIGHLFQDRFKSETVDDEGYFLAVLRYIHQNPLKVGLSNDIGSYRWSSYNDYIGRKGITDIEFALSITGQDRLIELLNEQKDEKILDVSDVKRMTDDELIKNIRDEFHFDPVTIQSETKEKRDNQLKKVICRFDVSAKQLSRITGISINIIWKAGCK